MKAGEGKIVCKRGAEGYQIVGVLPGVLSAEAPGIGIALKVSDGDASRLGSGLESTNRVRPAVVIEVLRQLGVLTSQMEQALAGFGPEKSITNHRGLVTGRSRPIFRLQS
jgi:L-asparaginase II